MAVDALLAEDLQSLSSVGQGTLGQVHVFLADDVESASEVSNPAYALYVEALNANSLSSLSEVGQGTLGQIHVLLADDIQSLSGPFFIHDIAANDITSLSSVSSITGRLKYLLIQDDATVASVTLYQTEETA